MILNSKKIIDRLKQVNGFTKDHQLAEWLGISKQALSSAKGRNSIDLVTVYQKLVQSDLTSKVSLHWVATGEGDVYTDKSGMLPMSDSSQANPAIHPEVDDEAKEAIIRVEGLTRLYEQQVDSLKGQPLPPDISLELIRSAIVLLEKYVESVEKARKQGGADPQ